LVGQANKRRLYKEAPFAADVDLYLKGQPTENFKTLLKITSKPSVLILRQLQLHGIDADPAMVDRLKALDDQKISMAAPRRRPTPQQNNALNGVQIATGAVSRVLNPVQMLGNALAPAAQAQTTPPPPQALDMSMFYADPGPKPKATQVAMAPPPPRPKPKPTVTPQARVDGYLKRLSYIETRLRNIPNAQGSAGRGYFQAFPPFAAEAKSASGGIDPRDPDFGRSAKATEAWIKTYNKKAYAAIRAGRYDEADRLLRNTWPSLPGGSQAQDDKVQKAARKYLR
jgi:hypothetical protein